MKINTILPKINAFVVALNDHGIISAKEVNEHLSIIVGCSLAATHVNKSNCFLIDAESNAWLTDHAWRFNNVFAINHDLALARARDVISSAYNHITSKGHTSCTAPMITLGETEVSLMNIPQAHSLFLELNNLFCTEDGRKYE